MKNDMDELFESIRKIEIDHAELTALGIEASKFYGDDLDDSLWKVPEFVEEVVKAAWDGSVMSMMAGLLDDEVPFEKVLDECLSNSNDMNHRNFLNFLRKEIFSRSMSRSKADFGKIGASKEKVAERKKEFAGRFE